MIALSLILLAASTHVDLVTEVVRIPAGDRRYIEVGLKQRPAFVSADYTVEPGSGEVRLALVEREQLERLPGKPGSGPLPEGVLAITPPGRSGRLRYRTQVRGEYAVVIDNRLGTRAAAAHLRVSLDFGGRPGPEVTRLSPARQLTVIAITFAVFFAIVSYSARRLLHGFGIAPDQVVEVRGFADRKPLHPDAPDDARLMQQWCKDQVQYGIDTTFNAARTLDTWVPATGAWSWDTLMQDATTVQTIGQIASADSLSCGSQLCMLLRARCSFR